MSMPVQPVTSLEGKVEISPVSPERIRSDQTGPRKPLKAMLCYRLLATD